MNIFNSIGKLFKPTMTFNDNDNSDDIQFGRSMDATTKPPVQAPSQDYPADITADAKSVFEMFELLTPAQRLEFNAANMRIFCAGCGNALKEAGKACETCNGD